jgi:DNA repair protein RadC
MARLRDLEHEVFCCLHLDRRHRLTQFEELFRGTIDRANVRPREVVKHALRHNAAAVIIAHNHPLCCVAVSPPQPGDAGAASISPIGMGVSQ